MEPTTRARASRPEPRNVEARFTVDELFFSITDDKGRIRFGNDVFARTSGYGLDELIGRPHNVIRHPDMPRSAFKLLWDELLAGRAVATYVKNLSQDGAYYWVLALAMPAGDGFLSIRLKPTSPLLETVQALYAEMLDIEQRIEDGTRAGRDQAMEASFARMLEVLSTLGHDTYASFMRTALLEEITSREDQLAATDDLARRRATWSFGNRQSRLVTVHGACTKLQELLDTLVASVRQYGQLNEILATRSSHVLNLAEHIRVFSLNAFLASSGLGDRGAALGAVASLMRERSDAIGPVIGALDDEFRTAIEVLDDVGFRIAAGKLQTEMAAIFVEDLLEDDDQRVSDELLTLVRVLTDGVEQLLTSFATLDEHLGRLHGGIRRLQANLDGIRALEVNGRVEDARLGRADSSVTELFESIADRVSQATGQLREVREASRAVARREPDLEVAARRQVSRLLDECELVGAGG